MDAEVFAVIINAALWAVMPFARYKVVKKAIKDAVRELRDEDIRNGGPKGE